MPKAINVKKQVDEEWLRSRRECGPSVEDLRALLPSEPCVEIGVKVKGSGKRSEGVSQTCSTSFGLRASVDEETLQINYRLDFDPNDIFGELSTGLGGSAGMDASWKKLEAIDYMLGRSILLSSTM